MPFVFSAICVLIVVTMITQVAIGALRLLQGELRPPPTVIYVQINFAPDLPEQVGEPDDEYEGEERWSVPVQETQRGP